MDEERSIYYTGSNPNEYYTIREGEVVGPLDYYARHGPVTDPGPYAGLLATLPPDIPALCRAVQGLLIHKNSASLRGIVLYTEQSEECQLRSVNKIIGAILEKDSRPLLVARPPEKRLAIVCRDFAVLLTAALRALGIPARARAGFADYFRGPKSIPHFHVDHWVGEYWNEQQSRWVLVDAEIDQVERDYDRVEIDPYDVPRDRFLVAGRAWQLCRAGGDDPSRFGLNLEGENGLWYIQSQLVRDFAALNKVELLCWDCWGLGNYGPDDTVSPEVLTLLDQVAALSLLGNEAFAQLRTLYENEPRLRVPRVVASYCDDGVHQVDLVEAGLKLADVEKLSPASGEEGS